MYVLCKCGNAYYYKSHGKNNPSEMKHFRMKGHGIIGKYTFEKNIPEPYNPVNFDKCVFGNGKARVIRNEW